ncbi:Uncharacterised protein [Vibrio cholerae]|uniref:Uncharacterized protein n=1 Tax=Vibrio cholerae TaxID=666 RepID=A0A655R253_VIBCL|nr:Uncharacterised protein [Vibrio cholerae]CSA82123.1 Uncharacterised protein [Vibrio cholerae]CSB33897.1 Uncharacterised protein [Vibrio cholerae]CSB96257.1 Uncharacterised protein [Vibrio cholerae]CSC02426.1 Uncharacterised protein [Vibrio cholerae]
MLAEFLVLRRAFLSFTNFEHDVVRIDIQHLNGCANNIGQTTLRFLFRNILWRCIFLDHEMILVDINSHIVFGKIRIIEAEAIEPLTLSPFANLVEVFLQTVGKIGGNEDFLSTFIADAVLLSHGYGVIFLVTW